MASKDSPALETIGNYDLLEKIHEGSMGTVYKARHWQSKEIVALKIIAAEVSRNPVLLKRFEQEFRITSKLDHQNVVRVLEYSANNGAAPYFVMEYVEGESVGDRIERDGALPEEEAVRIIVQIAHGLHRAHRQGLIHRDVKPDNIMVTPDGKAKLLDLGLAKDTDEGAELTKTGRGLGTPDFMAPEQFRNAKNASIRCDIYSLGATLYMMVTGRYPFDEDDPVKAMTRKLRNELPAPSDLVKGLSERTNWSIRRAMSANPDNRPESCREFVEDLIGQSTRRGSNPDVDPGTADVWYMVYTDDAGNLRTAKGNARAIRRSLKEGQLGDPIKVRGSRSTSGPFEYLHYLLEFRDLVVGPAPGPPLSEMSVANLTRMARPRADDDTPVPQPPRSEAPPPPAPSRHEAPPPPSRHEVPAAAVEVSTPHFRLPGGDAAPEPARPSFAMWKVILVVIVTVATTLIASKFLFPWK